MTNTVCRVTPNASHASALTPFLRGVGPTLWSRLRTHRGALSGTYEGGGNHRGSVFRERVGEALIERDGLHDDYPEWGDGSSAARELRLTELELEQRVSEYIRDLPFLWVDVGDEPGPESDRAYVERNTIALVSNYKSEPIDPRGDSWLGSYSPNEKIRNSGLWNINHVEESCDPASLDRLAEAIERTDPL